MNKELRIALFQGTAEMKKATIRSLMQIALEQARKNGFEQAYCRYHLWRGECVWIKEIMI